MICNKVIDKAKIIAMMNEDFNDVAAAAAADDDDNSEKSWPNLPTAFSMFSQYANGILHLNPPDLFYDVSCLY